MVLCFIGIGGIEKIMLIKIIFDDMRYMYGMILVMWGSWR